MSLRRSWALGLLALLILATAGIRLRLLGIPLDRDEGEYAYFGQLLLQGVLPYTQAYNFRFYITNEPDKRAVLEKPAKYDGKGVTPASLLIPRW